MTKYLTAIRHGRRVGESEEIVLNDRRKAEEMRRYLDQMGLGTPSSVVVSKLGRTLFTCRDLGFKPTLEIPRMSESVVNYDQVPWNGSFGEIQDSYHNNPATRELGELHGGIFRLMLDVLGDEQSAIMISHDTRAEAALASLVGREVSLNSLGKGLDYVEGYTLVVADNEIAWVQTHRTDPSQNRSIAKLGRVYR